MPNPPPTMLLIDPDEWDDVLLACASAAAMDINTAMLWDESVNSGLNTLSNIARMIPSAWIVGGVSKLKHGEYFSTGGAEVVGYAASKYRHDVAEFYNMFQAALARECAVGPTAALAYVNSRLTLARSATANVQYKFRETRAINDEVIHAWEVGMRRLDTMQTVINASFSVALSFAPGGVLILTAAGTAYPLACQLVTSATGVPNANVLGYVKKQGQDTLAGGGINAGQNLARFALRNRLIEQAAQRTEQTLARRLAAFAAQGGAQFSRAQRRSIGRAFAQYESSAARAAASGVRAGYFAGGLGAAVGLIFMREDISRAMCNIAEELAVPENS